MAPGRVEVTSQSLFLHRRRRVLPVVVESGFADTDVATFCEDSVKPSPVVLVDVGEIVGMESCRSGDVVANARQVARLNGCLEIDADNDEVFDPGLACAFDDFIAVVVKAIEVEVGMGVDHGATLAISAAQIARLRCVNGPAHERHGQDRASVALSRHRGKLNGRLASQEQEFTMLRRLWLFAWSALFGIGVLSAQNLSFTPFNNTNGLTLNGTATVVGTSVRLTQNAPGEVGTFFTSQRLGVVQGFDTIFDFTINPSSPGNHADGMTFVVHGDVSIADTLLGSSGGPLSYAGTLSNALVIEIDTWNNGNANDTSNNEISIHANGTAILSQNESQSLGNITPAVTLADASLHTLRVEYIPGTLNVYLDNLATPLLTVPYDFATGGTYLGGAAVPGLNLPDGTAWVGFTGTTGGVTQEASVDTWTWNSVGPDPCFDSRVGLAGGGPIVDVLEVDGRNGGYFRTVDVNVFQPFVVTVAQPPGNSNPAPFAVFGVYGAAANPIMSQFGPFCFVPSLLVPDINRFLLADSFGNHPTALVPSMPAPWAYGVPFGVPFPVQVTLQAVISEDNADPNARVVTNGVIIDVVPNPIPTISSVMPIAPMPGDVVTVTGQDFLGGATVTVGFATVVPTSVSSTSVVFTMPAGGGCDTPLTVTNPDQQSVMTTLDPTPMISSLTAFTGPAAGGNVVAIIGNSFTVGSTVTFDGMPAGVTTMTGNVIAVIVPPGTAGQTVSVVVMTPSGCLDSINYTYM